MYYYCNNFEIEKHVEVDHNNTVNETPQRRDLFDSQYLDLK